jgi:hypothetical protein
LRSSIYAAVKVNKKKQGSTFRTVMYTYIFAREAIHVTKFYRTLTERVKEVQPVVQNLAKVIMVVEMLE